MTDLYEFGVGGRIGPILCACVPELTLVTDAPSTVLTGTVSGPGGLRRVLDVLAANGLTTAELRLTVSDEDHHVPDADPLAARRSA